MFLRQMGHSRGRAEAGFTLIELLTVLSLVAILVTLAAFELRHFWLVRSLSGAQDEVTSQLRQLQEQVVAETHPNVFGALFPQSGTQMMLVRYNPDSGCRITRRIDLGAGIELQPGNNTNFQEATDPDITALCDADLPEVDNPNDALVFFFGRGTATPGRITLRQTLLDGDRREVICVSGLTGRVFPLDAGGTCPLIEVPT